MTIIDQKPEMTTIEDNPGSVLQVAIRDPVDFALKSGDLRSTFVGSGRALAGTRGH